MKSLIKILITVFVVIFIYSCSQDTVVNNGTASDSFTITGNIENWTLGGNIKLKAELWDTTFYPLVLDSAIVSTSGGFTLKLQNPPDNLLNPITFYPDTSCIVNVTINPPGSKSSNSAGLDLFNDSMYIGYIFRSNYSSTNFIPGQFFVYYLYFNQNVSITGSVVCNNGPYQDTTIYNLTGVRGWNKAVVSVNSDSKRTISSTEPAGGKWWVSTWSSDALPNKLSLRHNIFKLNNTCNSCK